MPGILVDKKQKTLRVDALAELGVNIVDIELSCNACGASYMLVKPWENGNFIREWYVCPMCGCNKPGSKRKAEYQVEPEEGLVIRGA